MSTLGHWFDALDLNNRMENYRIDKLKSVLKDTAAHCFWESFLSYLNELEIEQLLLYKCFHWLIDLIIHIYSPPL